MTQPFSRVQPLLAQKWVDALAGGRVVSTPSGRPILIDDPETLVDVEYLKSYRPEGGERREPLRLFLSSLRSSSYGVSEAHATLILDEMRGRELTVLVVGGGSIGPGVRQLADHPQVSLISFDIFDSPHVDFVADAHDIPIADAVIDIVWIQAVLEHVAAPWQVASEIHRVLKIGGLVYAETPFMQQVHAGRHDFTRFTALGHRMLFPSFDTVKAGSIDGPAVALTWSLRFLAAGLFRSQNAGRAVGLLFFWAKYLDRLIPERFKQMAASSFYFIGRKRSGPPLGRKAMLNEYAGI